MTHEANNELVYQAIKSGYDTQQKIMQKTGLNRNQVATAVCRLISYGRIRRKNLGGYYSTEGVCLLEQVWRKTA